MKLKRKVLILLTITMAIILGVMQNITYATKAATPLGLQLSYKRYTSKEGWGYALNNGTAHPIYQILSVSSDSNKSVLGTNYFCLDAETSYSWNYQVQEDADGNKYHTAGSIDTVANYTDYYDLDSAEDQKQLSSLEGFSKYQEASKYFRQIMWILDNMYVYSEDSNLSAEENEANNKKGIEAVMAKAGIVYGDTGATKAGEPIISYYGDEDNNKYYKTYKSNTLYANRDANGGYYYADSNGNQVDVLLSAEQIEAVEQAAIWYFTNYLGQNDKNYNIYTKILEPDQNGALPTSNFSSQAWLKYTTGTNTNSYQWPLLNKYGNDGDDSTNLPSEQEGKMLQEQATILYNYLVDAANDYASAHDGVYEGASNPITIEVSKESTQTKDSSYIFGKFKITENNTTPYTLDDKVTILDQNGDGISGAKIVDSNGTEITKTAKELVGTNFYVSVPKSSNATKVTVKVTGSYNKTKKLLWLSSEHEEQPIVEVEKIKEPIQATNSIELDTVFDLALRKAIVGVKTSDGTTKSVINENGNSAVRKITYDVDTLKSGTTATYNHRKDPVVIETGDIVKYSLTIYNEGSRKGYANEIVDQLPSGLALAGYTKNKTTQGTYTSVDGKVKYTYVYDPTTNTITFTNVTKNDLAIYESGETIDSETIEIECEVTLTPSNTNYTYLTNIAYISKAHDSDFINSDGQTGKDITTEVGADRDSEPANYPTSTQVTTSNTKNAYAGYVGGTNYSVYDDTKNAMYFAGKQDDDDFEVVVMLPKEFDLKLVKYISAVNGDTSKGKQVTKIDTTNLASGKDTTATYTLSKDPVKVKYGDYVTYTFRVYNEGEIDGYVTKLTDNIPLGLQFVQAKGDGKTITVYSYSAENGLTSRDIEVSEATYKTVDANNAYWTIDKVANESGTNVVKTDTYDGDTTPSISINVKDYLGGTNKLLNAYDSSKDQSNNGEGLTFVDVTVVLRVSETAKLDKIIRNEAAITGDSDSNGNDVTDRDSQPENWPGKDDHTKYQDDEDFDNVILESYDLALRKFIAAVSKDSKIEDGEYLSLDGTSKTAYTREPKVDTSKLKAGTAKTAIYNHTKDAAIVSVNDYVLYTIRVYNEGDLDTYASKITDHLPTYLDYIDCEFNDKYGWKVAEDGKTVTTTILSKEKETAENATILKAFDSNSDDGKGSGLSYRDVQILCRVNDKAVSNTNITNIAEISEYQGEDGTVLEKDRDSKPGNLTDEILKQETRPDYNGGEDTDKTDKFIPGQEDDDDFERVIVKRYDLALRKQIVSIYNAITKQETKYEDRYAKLDEKNSNKNTIYDYYDVENNIPTVVANDIVTYSIRVYNEGETDGIATWVTDILPSGLEYVKDNEINTKYGWKAYKESSKDAEKAIKIGEKYYEEVEFSSKEIAIYATEYLNNTTIKAYTGSGEASYAEVFMAARVKDKKEVTDKNYELRNIAEIGDDNGEDEDSTPGDGSKWKEQDDLDIEDLKLVEFDLSLLKYVSTVYVTEDGKTVTTQTNNVGDDKTDIIPKVEINRKKVNSTVVKFGYTIKITNEGDIAGYAKEITDYVPEGLKFYAEDNKGWTDEGNNVISTKLLENTLLQPGESAQVTVILRWINGSDNLGVKINTAEISEDYNDKHVPDRDSTPDNKVPGEDDIDDAKVLLSISTGLAGNIIMYTSVGLVILAVLGIGIVMIKKLVLE